MGRATVIHAPQVRTHVQISIINYIFKLHFCTRGMNMEECLMKFKWTASECITLVWQETGCLVPTNGRLVRLCMFSELPVHGILQWWHQVIALVSKELCWSWLTGQECEPRPQGISFDTLKQAKKNFLKIINHPPEKQKNNTAVNNSEIFWFNNYSKRLQASQTEGYPIKSYWADS